MHSGFILFYKYFFPSSFSSSFCTCLQILGDSGPSHGNGLTLILFLLLVSFCLLCALVCSGCHNKMTSMTGIYFLQFSRLENLRSRFGQYFYVPGLQISAFLLCGWGNWRGEQVLWYLLIRALIPSRRPYSHDLL